MIGQVKADADSANETTGDWRLQPVFGLHIGTPQKVSASVGIGRDRPSKRGAFKGYFVLVEPGLAGGKISSGIYELGPYGTGFAGRISLLRTWEDPWGIESNRTLIGVEGQVFGFALSPRVGVFYRTTGPKSEELWYVTGSFGFLF